VTIGAKFGKISTKPAKKLNNFVGGKAMQLVNILFYRGINVHCACKFTML